MQPTTINRYNRRIADAWLTASVHFDAFCYDPRAYLTATKWWIKRRRVRARGQFAPLFGQSAKAYMLWVSRQEQKGRSHSVPERVPPIIALIDIGISHQHRDLAVTLESLAAEGLDALLVGSRDIPTLAAATDHIDWGTQPWLLPMAPGDRIAPGAADAYRAEMGSAIRLIYADDDQLVGRRRDHPHFKPDWNPALFEHVDYLTGACVLKVSASDLAAMPDSKNWPGRLVTRIAGQGEVLHLRHMLHHRRQRPVPHLPVVPVSIVSDLPPVSIIVPTRNRVDLLKTCLDGVAATDYPDVEVIIMDNDSDDPETLAYLAALDPARHRVLRHGGAFNYSAINNEGVTQARGRFLCLLNNDIEMTDPCWLAIMATQALRAEVGAVGARLLYPDGRIQHAGVVIGVGNAAGHAHRFLRPEEEGYFNRHNLPQFTMAVTAACLVVERDKFLAVGGLDERNFAVAFNDVDLCLRLNQRGWQSFYEPRATLIHHESVSRGLDLDPVGAARFAGELAALKQIWKTEEIVDPYHHPQLSRASERFAVAL